MKCEFRDKDTLHVDLGAVHLWIRPHITSQRKLFYSLNITIYRPEVEHEGFGRWEKLPTVWLQQEQLGELTHSLAQLSMKGAAQASKVVSK